VLLEASTAAVLLPVDVDVAAAAAVVVAVEDALYVPTILL
jgi:hypothetical protein